METGSNGTTAENAAAAAAAFWWFQKKKKSGDGDGKTVTATAKIRPQPRHPRRQTTITETKKKKREAAKVLSAAPNLSPTFSSSVDDDDALDGSGANKKKKTKKSGNGFRRNTTEKKNTSDARENPIKEIRAMVTYEDVSPLNFWRAVADLDEYANFVPYVGKHKVLKTRGKLTDGSATFYVYGVVTAPVVKNRDYTIRIETKNNRKKGFESRWTLDTENVGPKPKKGVVRLLANDGGWTIQPSKKNRDGSLTADGVSVTYEILTDPGSNIPGWLIDKVNRASVPDVLRAMRKRALSGESSHILPDREERSTMAAGGRFHLPHFGFLDVGQLRDHKRLDSFADVVYKTSKTVGVKVNELFSEIARDASVVLRA
jgi:ribosome-associated toxin RatA of RatAB toxin-antitoxin module